MWVFHLEISVDSLEAAISLSFDSFSILTEVLEIHFVTFFRLFEKKYLDFSVEKILKLLWVFLS